MYELRGYISMEINRMEWTAYVACQDAVFKASVAKQSLVDDDQSTVCVTWLCVFRRFASLTPRYELKTGYGPLGEHDVSF